MEVKLHYESVCLSVNWTVILSYKGGKFLPISERQTAYGCLLLTFVGVYIQQNMVRDGLMDKVNE